MPVLIEHIYEIVSAIVIVVLLGTGALVIMAIARRQRRDKYFQRIDDLRQRYSPVIASLLTQKVEYQRGLEMLKGISGTDRDYVLEHLCLERKPTPDQVPVLRRLCEDLGLVKLWQMRLSGTLDVASLRDALGRPEGLIQRVGRLGFLVRAKAADNLGIIKHQPSWRLLVKALEDPHADVQSVAVRSLAALQEPESFTALVARLHDIVLKPASALSLRTLKTALVSFPLSQMIALLPSLRHSHRRIRFLATDIIREVVERQAAWEEDFSLDAKVFPSDLNEIFLQQLAFDENPDVRARAAPVIAYLADARSTPVLLTLLEDAQWFVRLHAVRAMGKRKYLSQAPQVSRRLTDPHWTVREAAARTLLVFGRVGSDQLAQHFLSTEDRYSREQIADEMQRAGLVPALLAQYGAEREGATTRVIDMLVQLGKTSYLVWALENNPDLEVRKKFLVHYGEEPDPQVRAWVTHVATTDADPALRTLAGELIRIEAPRGEG
jgi:HEAT repeat protein